MNTDLEEQENELLALQSIFGSEEFLRNESKSAGEFRVSVELPAGFTVLLKHGGTIRQYDVSFLPPLLLTFELPGDYPSSAPPSFTLTCSWLTHPQLKSLSDQLTDLYQATGGAVVLFSWIQFLREEALKQLDIHDLLELPSDQNQSSSAADRYELPASVPAGQEVGQAGQEVVPPGQEVVSAGQEVGQAGQEVIPAGQEVGPAGQEVVSAGQEVVSAGQEVVPPHEDQRDSRLSLTASQILLSQILIHDAEQKQKVFAATPFDCGVCFMSRLGSECVQLYECNHIFCRACLDEFWKAQITEGNIHGVTCPQVECSATPTPAQVKSLVGEELFHRYDRLLLQYTLDIMPDIVYCPRLTCGSAVILEKSSPAGMCSACSFAFCIDCKKTYHGTSKCYEEPELSPEESKDLLIALPKTGDGIQALMEDYAKGSKRRRRLLENRYGRKLFVYTFEKSVSDKWITTNTKPCPHCFSPIQKDGGCNHMFCAHCKRSFNWQ